LPLASETFRLRQLRVTKKRSNECAKAPPIEIRNLKGFTRTCDQRESASLAAAGFQAQGMQHIVVISQTLPTPSEEHPSYPPSFHSKCWGVFWLLLVYIAGWCRTVQQVWLRVVALQRVVANRRLSDRIELRQRKDVTGLNVSVKDSADPGVEIRKKEAVDRLRPTTRPAHPQSHKSARGKYSRAHLFSAAPFSIVCCSLTLLPA
jgi:hypothetical protein